ncbi:MAG: PH domain-containing protein [Candidatus Krumholzibacteriia bacterium]
MGYVEANLIPGEQVKYQARIHGIVLVPGIVLCATVVLAIIGLPLLIAALIQRANTEMAITNKRVIIKTGWITRKTLEMNLAKIENIGVDQGLFGRIWNFGTVTVVGTGGTREPFKYVAAPLDFRHAVQAQAEASNSG